VVWGGGAGVRGGPFFWVFLRGGLAAGFLVVRWVVGGGGVVGWGFGGVFWGWCGFFGGGFFFFLVFWVWGCLVGVGGLGFFLERASSKCKEV